MPEKDPREAAPRHPYAFRLPHDTVERVRDAVVFLETLVNAKAAGLIDRKAPRVAPGVSEFVERAIEREVARMEKDYNAGKSLPPRVTEPKRGRR